MLFLTKILKKTDMEFIRNSPLSYGRDCWCRILSCHQTEYEISGECCPLCPPGSRVQSHCTEFRSTSCMPCTEGTYNENSNGQQYCTPCSPCDSVSGLTVKHGCTLTSDSVCEPLDGFFCVDPSSKSCSAAQKHSSCEKGQYISQRGTASTDTECSDCSSGTFSDGTGESCQPHRQCEAENLQLTEAGTSSTDAQCGEQRQDVSAVVIGVLVPAVVLVVTAAVVVLLCRKNIIENTKSLKKGENDRKESNVLC
uniref:TNFR-Cys domain-containing protein n=1 Tax=Oryzias latipes TaxID=8090 RepID=A0A3P9MR36_ORYLA